MPTRLFGERTGRTAAETTRRVAVRAKGLERGDWGAEAAGAAVAGTAAAAATSVLVATGVIVAE
ncbi:hypothetical protein SAMN06297387_10294 [Streptomyces zhaozhouensis]|uniref:Uncharacterized protein n=1 Tax=Streptomyces zhaozhouensis TaxID=1300267 RepID=A0A286DP67_9ACTN|nr:hypothetical protein [Streptomyces zhaozhouensis]SOD60334.1 hypothetical protein SAMN06297387_10294 [Streptomyces zhaozhouensis]